MESALTLGRMQSVDSLISGGKSAASRAAIVARSESKLTETDRESLASGKWADDVSRITHGRLFYVDLPKAIAARAASRKKSGAALSKDARETLKTDACLFLVEWGEARACRKWQGEFLHDGKLVCKLGGSGNLPYKRDWLDPNNGEGVSDAAWDAMSLALNAAERADSDYAARKREERAARERSDRAAVSVDALLADGMDGLTAAEKASLLNDIDNYRAAWGNRAACVVEASTSEIARLLNLSQSAARYMESSLLHMDGQPAQPARRAYPGRPARVIHGQVIEKARPAEPAKRAQPTKPGRLSKAACAHQWGVSAATVKDICSTGKAELERKYPEPSELLSALRAAGNALPEIREDAARESILSYRAAPSEARRADADLAAREFLSATHAMPADRRALFVALVKRVDSARASVLVDVIPRLIAAEYGRESDNLRAGRRGILAGNVYSASDNSLYIGKRDWKTALEDSEILANRRAIAARAAARFRRYFIARLCPVSLAACLLALNVRETARQSAHERQARLAIEQSLDSSYSYQFHPTPNPYGRAYILADARAMADTEKRMEAARKLRLEAARKDRIQRKRATQMQAAKAARKRA